MAKSRSSSVVEISKPLVITLLLLLPVIGFYFGLQYQQRSNTQINDVNNEFFNTEVSEKPRDKVISYTVQKGDTLPIIAQRFIISEDTIRWENILTDVNLTDGQTLRILPVTGVSHLVGNGDTIESVAERYKTDPQKIIDFPFNDFANPENFTLIPGKIIIVPDGKK